MALSYSQLSSKLVFNQTACSRSGNHASPRLHAPASHKARISGTKLSWISPGHRSGRRGPVKIKATAVGPERKTGPVGPPPFGPSSISPPINKAPFQDDDDFMGACEIAYIHVDNETHTVHSILDIEVSGVPGLLRIISWLLCGLNLVVKEADFTTDNEGIVNIKFEITEITGAKVIDPDGLEERLTDYMRFCTAAESAAAEADVIHQGGITVDNGKDENLTWVSINSTEMGSQSLLSAASTITGLGLIVRTAKMTTSETGSHWEIGVVTIDANAKLDYKQAAGLMYTLCLVCNTNGTRGAGGLMSFRMTA